MPCKYEAIIGSVPTTTPTTVRGGEEKKTKRKTMTWLEITGKNLRRDQRELMRLRAIGQNKSFGVRLMVLVFCSRNLP